MSTLRILTLTAVVAPVFLAAPAFAGDDPKHPAYDFQPTIIQKAVEAAPAAAAAPAPAAAAAAPASTGESTPASQPDPKYPGAHFTPRVIYP